MTGPGRLHEALKEKALLAPEKPGCYLFRSASGALLYVGKAKDLRRRLLSYFQRSDAHTPRTVAMLAEAANLEIILAGSEVEALILENTLVKRRRPRYNVLLRDDKTFPYLKLTVKDPFPRVILVRRPVQDGNLYFGPYVPASVARRTLSMVARYFQVATCYESFDGARQRPCILYQMHQCLAPCVGHAEREAYARAVADVRSFLEGKDADLATRLRERMDESAAQLDYERAAHFRDLLRALEALARRQTLASVGMEDQDYFGLEVRGEKAVLEVFEMRGGLVQSRREFFIEEAGGIEDLMGEAITRYYAAAASVPGRILASSPPEDPAWLERWLGERRGARVRISVPSRGAHRTYLDTVLENARHAWEERFGSGPGFAAAVQESLRDILDLDEAPVRIEGFDISHVQGTETSASIVVWEGGRPRRAAWRRLKIETPTRGDDYAALTEAVRRRYTRLLREGKPLPDLVLIDGGRGQLGAACRALETLGITTLPVIGLAKREEEIFVPGREEPLRLPPNSPALHLLTRIRDEAHRFAVSYHRRRRARRTLATVLTRAPGIGPRRARALLVAFGSVDGVRRAGDEDVRHVIGASATRALRRFLAEQAAEARA